MWKMVEEMLKCKKNRENSGNENFRENERYFGKFIGFLCLQWVVEGAFISFWKLMEINIVYKDFFETYYKISWHSKEW